MIDIANGSFRQSLNIMEDVEEDKEPKQVGILTFNMYLEEIWDFFLQFQDWK